MDFLFSSIALLRAHAGGERLGRGILMQDRQFGQAPPETAHLPAAWMAWRCCFSSSNGPAPVIKNKPRLDALGSRSPGSVGLAPTLSQLQQHRRRRQEPIASPDVVPNMRIIQKGLLHMKQALAGAAVLLSAFRLSHGRHLRQVRHRLLHLLHRVLVVFELPMVIGLVGHHTCTALGREACKCRCVEVAVAAQVECDDLLLARFLALARFVNRHADGMGALRHRDDTCTRAHPAPQYAGRGVRVWPAPPPIARRPSRWSKPWCRLPCCRRLRNRTTGIVMFSSVLSLRRA